MKIIRKIGTVLGLCILGLYITFTILLNPGFQTDNPLTSQAFSHEILSVRYSMLSCFIILLAVCIILNFSALKCGLMTCRKDTFAKMIGAILFAIIQTISIDFYYFNSLIYVIDCPGILLYNVLCLTSYGILFFCIENVCFYFLDKASSTGKAYKVLPDFIQKHIGKFSFIFIMLCWLPWIIAFYPGSIWYDMCYQIEQYYFGNYHLHPIFVTLCMGLCMDIGKNVFASDNIGVFIYILLQSITCAFAFSRVIKFLNALKASKIVLSIVLVFYCFSPIFGAYMQIGTKDVLSCGLYVLFTVQALSICQKLHYAENVLSSKEIAALFITSTLCSLYRKETIILCMVTFGVILFICLKEKLIRLFKDIASVAIGMLTMYIFFDVIVINVFMGVTFNAGTTEGLSIPLQQIARFVYYESDLVAEEEREILDNTFYYGYEGIADHYNPYLSDPIKYNVGNVEELSDLWVSLFMKKPTVYIEATIANSFGYYSIIPALPPTVSGAPTNGTPGSRFEFYINRDPDLENQMVMISYAPAFEKIRSMMSAYAINLRDAPIINLIYSLGFYTWGAIILVIYVWRRKNGDRVKSLIAFIPIILSILVCIASPVNDCLRYFLPVIAILPLMVGWTVATQNNSDRSDENYGQDSRFDSLLQREQNN